MNIIGSLMMIIGLVLPWYSDVDSFGSGDLYIGIMGPTFLIGLTMMAVALCSIGLSLGVNMRYRSISRFVEKNKLGSFQFIGGIVSFYLLFVINSVFFHVKFGLNVLQKNVGIGVFFSLMACGIMTIGGYLIAKNSKKNEAVARSQDSVESIKNESRILRNKNAEIEESIKQVIEENRMNKTAEIRDRESFADPVVKKEAPEVSKDEMNRKWIERMRKEAGINN